LDNNHLCHKFYWIFQIQQPDGSSWKNLFITNSKIDELVRSHEKAYLKSCIHVGEEMVRDKKGTLWFDCFQFHHGQSHHLVSIEGITHYMKKLKSMEYLHRK